MNTPGTVAAEPLVLDLFAGPGGWDQGAADLGLAPLGIEWDADACATAEAAGHRRQLADVASLNPRAYAPARGLIASPPCQGFSTAGKGKGRLDAVRILEGLPHVRTLADVEALIAELRPHMLDDKSLLALEPLRWALALTPSWLAWEQVRQVLPLWEACASVLRRIGYTVETGVLSAEQYGIPQTRQRAILVARAPWLTRELGPASLPAPTHSRYHRTNRLRLDPGVLPWISMAKALGWGATARPALTITGGGTATGGAEPFAKSGREALRREMAAGRWVMNAAGATGLAPRDVDEPAATITGAGSAAWVLHDKDADRHIRRLAVEEAGVLQSFPADYPWTGKVGSRYQQVGNAVPPLLARVIVAEVAGLAALEDAEVAA